MTAKRCRNGRVSSSFELRCNRLFCAFATVVTTGRQANGPRPGHLARRKRLILSDTESPDSASKFGGNSGLTGFASVHAPCHSAVGFCQVESTAADTAGRHWTPLSLAHLPPVLKGRKNMTASTELNPTNLPGQPRSRYEIDCGGAKLHVHARSVATVLTIDGEVDACNADRVSEAIQRFSRLGAPVILDLTALDFLGSAGLHALVVANDAYRQAQTHCCVVGGAALRRLIRVLPDHGLLVVDSVPEALRQVRDVIVARRRFVTDLARQHEPLRGLC